MNNYSIITNRGEKNQEILDFEGTEEQAIVKMLERYQYFFDDQFFINEEKTECHDCDGELTWSTGETYIGAGDRHSFIELAD